MELSKVWKIARKVFDDLDLEADIEYKEENEVLFANAKICIPSLGDLEAYGGYSIYTGADFVTFNVVVAEIKTSGETFWRLNEFNAQNTAHTAVIDEEGWLMIQHTALYINEELLEPYMKDLLDWFNTEEFAESIQPLAEMFK